MVQPPPVEVTPEPDLARAHLNLGLGYAQTGSKAKAIRSLETAAALDSTLDQTRFALRKLRAAED